MSSPKKNRSPARLLSKVFLQSESPFYLVDPRGQIAFVNSALSNLVQVASDELLGQSCLSPIPDSKLPHGKILAWLSIPPEILLEENDPSQPKPSISIRSLASSMLPTPSSAVTPKNSSPTKEINTSVCVRISHQNRLWIACWLFNQDEWTLKSLPIAVEQFPIHEQLVQFRQEFLQADTLYGVVGSSFEAKRCRAQIQAAMACDQPVCIRGVAGSSSREVAQAILAGRRKRIDSSDSSGQLFPLECPLMDSALLANFFELIESNTTRGSAAQKPCVLFVDLDRAPQETHLQIATFLRNHPGHSWMATTSREGGIQNAFEGVLWREIANAVEVLPVDIPSIASRPDDLPVMVESILHLLRRRNPGVSTKGLHEKSMSLLKAYAWPGDSRELFMAIESAVESSKNSNPPGMIEPNHLPVSIRTYASFVDAQAKQEEPWDLDRILEDVEKSLIEHALDNAQGNRASAARFLNISRARLLRRLEQLGMVAAQEPTEGTQEIDGQLEKEPPISTPKHQAGEREKKKREPIPKSKGAEDQAKRGHDDEAIEFTEIDFIEDEGTS